LATSPIPHVGTHPSTADATPAPLLASQDQRPFLLQATAPHQPHHTHPTSDAQHRATSEPAHYSDLKAHRRITLNTHTSHTHTSLTPPSTPLTPLSTPQTRTNTNKHKYTSAHNTHSYNRPQKVRAHTAAPITPYTPPPRTCACCASTREVHRSVCVVCTAPCLVEVDLIAGPRSNPIYHIHTYIYSGIT
jgi:hypothetical protein